MTHRYRSTYCQHDKHDDCRLVCKVCGTGCRCSCHHNGWHPGVFLALASWPGGFAVMFLVDNKANDPNPIAAAILAALTAFLLGVASVWAVVNRAARKSLEDPA